MRFCWICLNNTHTVRCRIALHRLFLIFITLLFAFCSYAADTNETDCGVKGCKVKFVSRYEVYIACEAIKRAQTFFKEYEYEIIPQITIEFIKSTNKNGVHSCESVTNDFPAWYDSGKKCILITSREADYCWDRKIFGKFNLDLEFITSIVTHEVAHRFFDNILKSRKEITNHSFHEFIAYVTQLETMDESNKSLILSLWPHESLPSVFAINHFNWMANPDKFCVLSYRFFKSRPKLFKQILDGKIKPIEGCFIFNY